MKNHREYGRMWMLNNKYDMTEDDYAELLTKQNNCCAICKGQPTGRYKVFHVDHCHTTNKVRGLLCQKCNHALGLFNDNVSLLEKAIEYLNA